MAERWECPECGEEATTACGQGFYDKTGHRWSFWERESGTDEELKAEMDRRIHDSNFERANIRRIGHIEIELEHRRGKCQVCQFDRTTN